MNRSERVATVVLALLALATGAAWLSPDPHNVAQRSALAAQRAAEGDWHGAVQLHLDNARASRNDGAGRVDALMAASKVALEARQHELALNLYLEARQHRPELPPTQLSRYGVELYVAMNDHATALEQARAFLARPEGREDLALLELVVGAPAAAQLAPPALALLTEQVDAQPDRLRLAELTCRTIGIAPFPASLHEELSALAQRVVGAHPQLDCAVREPEE